MSGNSIGIGEEIRTFCKRCLIYACLSGTLVSLKIACGKTG